MKVLVASHTYIVDLNCEKLRSLTRDWGRLDFANEGFDVVSDGV